jgi:peptide-methionine (R)-S-oxide reductase
MKRRTVLAGIMALPFAWGEAARAQEGAGDASLEDIRNNWKALLAPGAEVELSTAPLVRSNADWKKILSETQYRVLREEDTERAYTSALDKETRPGVYVCAGCSLPLFSSRMKYDSGSGWPSFFTHIPGHLGTKKDFFLVFLPRTEYHCVRCGGHQGHVFDDGPPPTGERWCNNGVALRFIPHSVGNAG